MAELSGTAIIVRFVLGGLAVVVSTLIARFIGGRVGGIFAAFPAVYLAAVISVTWHTQGDQAMMAVESISKGAMIGMLANMVCAVVASYLIIKRGHWKGILLSLGIWLGASSILYFSFLAL